MTASQMDYLGLGLPIYQKYLELHALHYCAISSNHVRLTLKPGTQDLSVKVSTRISPASLLQSQMGLSSGYFAQTTLLEGRVAVIRLNQKSESIPCFARWQEPNLALHAKQRRQLAQNLCFRCSLEFAIAPRALSSSAGTLLHSIQTS